jgi:hypothetical protein
MNYSYIYHKSTYKATERYLRGPILWSGSQKPFRLQSFGSKTSRVMSAGQTQLERVSPLLTAGECHP